MLRDRERCEGSSLDEPEGWEETSSATGPFSAHQEVQKEVKHFMGMVTANEPMVEGSCRIVQEWSSKRRRDIQQQANLAGQMLNTEYRIGTMWWTMWETFPGLNPRAHANVCLPLNLPCAAEWHACNKSLSSSKLALGRVKYLGTCLGLEVTFLCKGRGARIY